MMLLIIVVVLLLLWIRIASASTTPQHLVVRLPPHSPITACHERITDFHLTTMLTVVVNAHEHTNIRAHTDTCIHTIKRPKHRP